MLSLVEVRDGLTPAEEQLGLRPERTFTLSVQRARARPTADEPVRVVCGEPGQVVVLVLDGRPLAAAPTDTEGGATFLHLLSTLFGLTADAAPQPAVRVYRGAEPRLLARLDRFPLAEGHAEALYPLVVHDGLVRRDHTPLHDRSVQASAGRALLVLHGTGRDSGEGFAAPEGFDPFPRAWLAQYQGRVWAYDHRTLSRSPEENAQGLLNELARVLQGPGPLEVDLLSQSRGGLVARALCEPAVRWGLAGQEQLRVRRVVLVSSPSAGTPPAEWALTLDVWCADLKHRLRWRALRRLLGPPLTLLLTLVRPVAAIAQSLPGLVALAPGSALLQRLNGSPTPPQAELYAAVGASRYEDLPGFGGACDGVVPLRGVFDPGPQWPSFYPITGPRSCSLEDTGHQQIFQRYNTWDHLQRVLGAP